MTPATELHLVQQILARERLSLDVCDRGRTCFLSHLGANTRLATGPWLGHRDLIFALALANLAPNRRASLARAVRVEHGHEFGVGRLTLRALPSGLPLGGSSLWLRPRTSELRCLYTWALTPAATPAASTWLLLRAEPSWALREPPKLLTMHALSTLAALDATVVVLVATATDARMVAEACLGQLPFAAHPRFAPHLADLGATAPTAATKIRLWPHDAVTAPGFWPHHRKAEPGRSGVVILVDAPDVVERQVHTWHGNHADAKRIEVSRATCPGRMQWPELAAWWQACEQPQVLLRGLPEWTHPASAKLHDLGAHVDTWAQSTQLALL